MYRKEHSVIVPSGVFPKPSKKELSAAYILSDFFETNVKFIPRDNCKTPDLLIDYTEWELKSPTGNGKRNLQHTINRAIKQSHYIIIDARFSKIHISQIESYLSNEIKRNRQIKRILVINKKKDVVEIFR